MNKHFTRLLSLAAALVMLLPLLAACGGDTAPTATPAAATGGGTTAATATTAASTGDTTAPKQLPRNETLYIGGFQWQPPANFNPLNNNPDWPAQGGFMEIYEALFAYNQLSGNLDPLLAKELKTPDATTMDITLQDGTMWQDGQKLTPDDVVYTYELAKSQSDINYSTLFNYIESIKSTGDRTLEIKLKQD